MIDKNDFIQQELNPLLGERRDDYDVDAIFDAVTVFEPVRGFDWTETITCEYELHGSSPTLNYILWLYDKSNFRCILFDDNDEQTLYHVKFNADGEEFEVAACTFADDPTDLCTTSDWQGEQPRTIDECDEYDWVWSKEWLDDPHTTKETRDIIELMMEDLCIQE